MNGLSSALSTALSGLLVTAGQSAVVSRNVTRAGDADYSRKDVALTTSLDGTARLGQYTRSTDKNLQDRMLASASANSTAQAIADSLKILSSTIGDPEDETSVAAGLYSFQQALRDFENNPSLRTTASSAVSAARSLTSKINSAANEIASLRNDANTSVAASVANINTLLTKLQPIDQSLRTTQPGTESYVESQDQRDAILKELSNELGLRIVNKSDGGVALYTDSGVTLFDKVPRRVETASAGLLSSGTAGPAVFIDGVQVSGPASVLPLKQGKLLAALQVRDELTLTYEAQLDEIARSLVSGFAERDQSVTPTLPDATGLFTYAGAPAVPPSATRVAGLAASLKIAAAFDENVGGNPLLLRDGGSNGAAYGYNLSGESGFQQRLSSLVGFFDLPLTYDPAARLPSQTTIKQFASASAADVEGKRSEASATADTAKAVHQRWTEALLRKTGVNLDEEMSSLLSLEKSYQASAKVMTTVDQMFATLVSIVR
jgi:flagellar hook-associated protein 1